VVGSGAGVAEPGAGALAEDSNRRGIPAASESGRSRLVLLGPPNAGKGTQAVAIAERLHIPRISTGDMLRDEVVSKSELGMRVEGIMARGELVEDETMAAVVRSRLGQPDARGGFLLDGYPRTVPQAETLKAILSEMGESLKAVLLLEVPDDELVRRALLRGREDDREDVLRERLRVYREKTSPLVGYFGERGLLRRINGNREVAQVTEQVLQALGLAA
jgi:adenylate kinase